eukprot:13315526-Alexandrium_andersonii.AAC.1
MGLASIARGSLPILSILLRVSGMPEHCSARASKLAVPLPIPAPPRTPLHSGPGSREKPFG